MSSPDDPLAAGAACSVVAVAVMVGERDLAVAFPVVMLCFVVSVWCLGRALRSWPWSR